MFHRRSLVVSTSLVAVGLSTSLGGQTAAPSLPGTFVPDWTFKGSSLTGTDQIGQAKWRAENGEIIGTRPAPTAAGYSSTRVTRTVQVAGSYRCAAECTAGVMLRGEKSASGIKGIYTTLAGGRRRQPL